VERAAPQGWQDPEVADDWSPDQYHQGWLHVLGEQAAWLSHASSAA
jgi:hypothetical protein